MRVLDLGFCRLLSFCMLYNYFLCNYFLPYRKFTVNFAVFYLFKLAVYVSIVQGALDRAWFLWTPLIE